MSNLAVASRAEPGGREWWKECLLNHLKSVLPGISQQLLDGVIGGKNTLVLEFLFFNASMCLEYNLPPGLSVEQVNELYSCLPPGEVTLEVHWFPPILEAKLVLDRSQREQRTLARIVLASPAALRDQLLQLNRYRCRRLPSDRSIRSGSSPLADQSYGNFNVLTYFNRLAMVPPVIPVYLNNARAVGVGSGNCLGQIQIFLTEQTRQDGGSSSSSTFGQPRRIQVMIGLIKEDKVNFIVALNNQHAFCRQPCRIVYLQSHSLLTFWMAMKVKALCNDLYWNVVGYQITLESKTSPNNSVIFFEMSTFIRALNRNLNLRLITHLVIDIDHDHLLFKLLFLYLKQHHHHLSHLVIYIITGDEKKVAELGDYFGADNVRSVRFNYPNIASPYVKQQFIEDFYPVRPGQGENNERQQQQQVLNDQLERLMPECWTQVTSVQDLLDFITPAPNLLNYACAKLNGITPLILAIVRGTTQQVYRLLVLGADVRKASWNHAEPIEWAIQFRKEDTFQLIFTHLYSLDEAFDIIFQRYYVHKINRAARRLSIVADLPALSPVQRPKVKINYEMILYLLPLMIEKIYFEQMFESGALPDNQTNGSIIVLLPSYDAVSYLRKLIINELTANVKHDFTVLCLYANVPNSELEPGIECLNSARGTVHVILSTFGADCMFLDNICYIINTGVEQAKLLATSMTLPGHRLIPNQTWTGGIEYEYSLNLVGHRSWTVNVYNLFTRAEAVHMIGKDEGELKTVKRLYTDSMYHCIYAMKCFNFPYHNTEEVFARMSCNNKKEMIAMSVNYLKNINVLQGEREELTELGKTLMDLAIEPHYAKMIIYSIIFRCLDPILTIVCALSSCNPFQFEIESDAMRWQKNCYEVFELSHHSFSDHLAYVYAFQKWQGWSRACQGPSTSSAGGLGLTARQSSMFEMIYSLRTRLLGQLRAMGFVKSKGTLNIRNLNSNAENFSLVKAAICGGQPLDHFVLTSRLADTHAFLHPTSVLAHHFTNDNVRLPSEVLLFDRRFTGGRVNYLHNCTLINPLTVVLFIDENAAHPVVFQASAGNGDEGTIKVGSLFELSGEHMGKLFQVRQQLQATIMRRLNNMQQLPGDDENHLLRDVTHLVSAHDDCLGFPSQPAIGKAPQVMSTYFCSTVVAKKNL